MPNTPAEDNKIAHAISLIEMKYKPWIIDNGVYRKLSELKATVGTYEFTVKYRDETGYSLARSFTQGSNRPDIGCSSLGFTETIRGVTTIYINRNRCNALTIVHELLHAFTHPTFTAKVSFALDEAVTEYFTRKVQGRAASAEDKQFEADTKAIVETERTSYNAQHKDLSATRASVKKFFKAPQEEARAEHEAVVAAAVRRVVPQDRIVSGSHRNVGPLPAAPEYINLKDYMKRAYFRGDREMIDYLLEYFHVAAL